MQDPEMVEPLVALAQRGASASEREAAVRALGEMKWAASGALDELEVLERAEEGRLADACRSAIRRIKGSFGDAPDELIAAGSPEGRGTEPEAVS